MDVLLQAGVNPNLLISKAGKNIRYTSNGKKRLAFGSVGQNAKTSIDGENADLETEVEEGNQITVVFAQNGLDANPQVCDIISNIDSIDVTLDGKIVNIEPVCLVNNEEKSFIEKLNDGDEVEVFIPNTVEKFKKYVVKESKDLYINDKMLEDDFLLKEGMNNEYVRAVQELLNLRGYNCGKADGIFGSNTKSQVIKIQTNHNLTPDGIIGADTWPIIIAN